MKDSLPHWDPNWGKPKEHRRIATAQEMEQVQYLRDFGPNDVPKSVHSEPSRHPMMAEVDRLAEIAG